MKVTLYTRDHGTRQDRKHNPKKGYLPAGTIFVLRYGQSSPIDRSMDRIGNLCQSCYSELQVNIHGEDTGHAYTKCQFDRRA
jgi:hypothetical protein